MGRLGKRSGDVIAFDGNLPARRTLTCLRCGSLLSGHTGGFCCDPPYGWNHMIVDVRESASTLDTMIDDPLSEALALNETEKGHGVGHRMTPRKRSKCRRHKTLNCNVPGC